MSATQSPFREGDNNMPDEKAARLDLAIIELASKVGAVSEGFVSFKKDVKSTIETSHAHCREDMKSVYGDITKLKAWQAGHDAANAVKASAVHANHHWQHMIILILGMAFGALGIKVLH